MSKHMPRDIDVLVVGAGPAGAVAAKHAAVEGFGVLLVDRLPAEDVGRKTCGNGLAIDGATAMRPYADPPSGAEIAWEIQAGALVLSDTDTRVTIPKSGFVLNRLVFGQRLLGEAIEAGAEFVDGCSCAGWSDRESNRVRLDVEGGESEEVTARVVVDASGYRAVLTRTGGPLRHETLGRDDVGIGYREILPLTSPLAEPRTVIVDLGAEEARGGYAWIFPMGERLANIGLGAPLSTASRDLRSVHHAFLERYPDIRTTDPLEAGAGMLPLRRPLVTMVGNGFIAAGDAGCQANPLHGGGIAPGIIGGGMAGRTAAEALRSGSSSADALWPYSLAFMREVGARHAAHDFLRRVLFSLSPQEFDFLTTEMAGAGVLVEALAEGGTRLPLLQAFKALARAARRPRLVALFLRAGRLVESIHDLYSRYPDSVDRLDSWIGRVEVTLRALRSLVED